MSAVPHIIPAAPKTFLYCNLNNFAPCCRASCGNCGASYRHHRELQHLLVLQKDYKTTDRRLVSLLCHQNRPCQWNPPHPLDKHSIVHLREWMQQSWMWGESTHLLMLLIQHSLFSGAHLQDSGEDHTDCVVCVCVFFFLSVGQLQQKCVSLFFVICLSVLSRYLTLFQSREHTFRLHKQVWTSFCESCFRCPCCSDFFYTLHLLSAFSRSFPQVQSSKAGPSLYFPS